MQTFLANKWGLFFVCCLALHAYVTIDSQLSSFEPPKRQSADMISAFVPAKIEQAFEKGQSFSLLFGIKPTEQSAGAGEQQPKELLFTDLSPVLVAVSESNGKYIAKLKLTIDGKSVWRNVSAGQQIYDYDVIGMSLHRIELSRQQDTVVLPLFTPAKAATTN